MNDNITINTPYAMNTDRVRMPEIKENATGALAVDFEQLQPLENRLGKVLTFGNTAQREAIQKIINDPPSTLGELWYDYLMLVAAQANSLKNLNALERGLGRVNTAMNEYADDQNWCGQYDETLPTFTRMLVEEGYAGWFEFTGRTEEVDVMVERRRTVVETVTVRMEKLKGADADYQTAVDMASDYDDSEWEVTDECYDTDFYEVVNVENVY